MAGTVEAEAEAVVSESESSGRRAVNMVGVKSVGKSLGGTEDCDCLCTPIRIHTARPRVDTGNEKHVFQAR